MICVQPLIERKTNRQANYLIIVRFLEMPSVLYGSHVAIVQAVANVVPAIAVAGTDRSVLPVIIPVIFNDPAYGNVAKAIANVLVDIHFGAVSDTIHLISAVIIAVRIQHISERIETRG